MQRQKLAVTLKSPPSPLEESAFARQEGTKHSGVIYSFECEFGFEFGHCIALLTLFLFVCANIYSCHHLLLEYEDPPVRRRVSTMGIKGTSELTKD